MENCSVPTNGPCSNYTVGGPNSEKQKQKISKKFGKLFTNLVKSLANFLLIGRDKIEKVCEQKWKFDLCIPRAPYLSRQRLLLALPTPPSPRQSRLLWQINVVLSGQRHAPHGGVIRQRHQRDQSPPASHRDDICSKRSEQSSSHNLPAAPESRCRGLHHEKYAKARQILSSSAPMCNVYGFVYETFHCKLEAILKKADACMLAGLLQWLFVCDFAAWAPFWCLSPLSPPDMHRSVHVTVQVRCEILFRTLLCEICFFTKLEICGDS